MGLKIMKYHVIIHMVLDMLLYGVPLEFDTGANESHHKKSKHAARLTQRNEANFHIQVAKRLFEFLVIDLALEEVEHGRCLWDYYVDCHLDGMEVDDTDKSDSDDPFPGSSSDESGSFPNQTDNLSNHSSEKSDDLEVKVSTDDCRIEVFLDERTGNRAFNLVSRSKHANKTTLNLDLLDFLFELQDEVIGHLPTDCLRIYTRRRR